MDYCVKRSDLIPCEKNIDISRQNKCTFGGLNYDGKYILSKLIIIETYLQWTYDWNKTDSAPVNIDPFSAYIHIYTT